MAFGVKNWYNGGKSGVFWGWEYFRGEWGAILWRYGASGGQSEVVRAIGGQGGGWAGGSRRSFPTLVIPWFYEMGALLSGLGWMAVVHFWGGGEDGGHF